MSVRRAPRAVSHGKPAATLRPSVSHADRLRALQSYIPKAPTGNYWIITDAMTEDKTPPETADLRLERLRDWASVNNNGSAAFVGTQPEYADFNALSYNRTQVPVGAPTGQNFNMVNILIWSNDEICKKRYVKYKTMIKETSVNMKRLAKLYDIDENSKDDAKNGPEMKQYVSLQKRVKALGDVKREAFRRRMGIALALNIPVDRLIEDEEDEAQHREIIRRSSPPAVSGAAPDAGKDDPVKAYDPVKQLADFKDAINNILTNYTGNDLLKDFIYADIVSFMADGAAAMDVYRNYVFMGPSGVGKTTWARLMGSMYRSLGIYMYGTVAETQGSDYVGSYVGWSGPQTQGVLDGNLENIVLIDEAYSITDGGQSTGGSNYGAEAISALVNYMDKNRGCIMIVLAGYEGKMKDSFLKANEGLDRRFPNQFVFPAYTSKQLVVILQRMLEKYDLLHKWESNTWTLLQGLVELCMQHAERRKNPANAANPSLVAAAPFYDELFSKQGGSMENLANQVVTYCALPDKKPSRWGRASYSYDPDMIAILASKLDRKWHSGINDSTSLVQRVFRAPIEQEMVEEMEQSVDE